MDVYFLYMNELLIKYYFPSFLFISVLLCFYVHFFYILRTLFIGKFIISIWFWCKRWWIHKLSATQRGSWWKCHQGQLLGSWFGWIYSNGYIYCRSKGRFQGRCCPTTYWYCCKSSNTGARKFAWRWKIITTTATLFATTSSISSTITITTISTNPAAHSSWTTIWINRKHLFK